LLSTFGLLIIIYFVPNLVNIWDKNVNYQNNHKHFSFLITEDTTHKIIAYFDTMSAPAAAPNVESQAPIASKNPSCPVELSAASLRIIE